MAVPGVAVLLLVACLGAALHWTAEPVAANGCTPCECGAAYCEGSHVYWGAIEWAAGSPEYGAVVGYEWPVYWRLTLEPAEDGMPPANGTWSHGQTGLAYGRSPLVDANGTLLLGNATLTEWRPAVFPSFHRGNLTFDAAGPWYVLALLRESDTAAPTAWTTQGNVTVEVEGPAAHGDPAPSAWAVAAAVVGLAVLVRRRWR